VPRLLHAVALVPHATAFRIGCWSPRVSGQPPAPWTRKEEGMSIITILIIIILVLLVIYLVRRVL
jgi:hypothetical protein